jgi:hypothetical protein
MGTCEESFEYTVYNFFSLKVGDNGLFYGHDVNPSLLDMTWLETTFFFV